MMYYYLMRMANLIRWINTTLAYAALLTHGLGSSVAKWSSTTLVARVDERARFAPLLAERVGGAAGVDTVNCLRLKPRRLVERDTVDCRRDGPRHMAPGHARYDVVRERDDADNDVARERGVEAKDLLRVHQASSYRIKKVCIE